jgi:thioredoxin reductase
LGEKELLVVGAGPAGLSALFEARKQGISAVGIEAGKYPANAIYNYLDGLPVLSPPEHYEIDELPLDCRDPTWVTREELLHYYARIINYGRLDIQCGLSCGLMENLDGKVIVPVLFSDNHEPAGYFLAKNVIFTAWHAKKSVDTLIPKNGTTLKIYKEGIRSPIEVAGKNTVVLGGGASAVEQAGAIMRCGQSVTILARNKISPAPAEFYKLAKSTKSILVENANQIRIHEHSLSYSKNGKRVVISADAVVFTIGTNLIRQSLTNLQRLGVLTKVEVKQLIATEDLLNSYRLKPHKGDQRAQVRDFAKSQPNLWRHVFEGVRGVRLAGGILHWGAARGAVDLSIMTAQLAVESIRGKIAIPADSELSFSEDLWKYLQEKSFYDLSMDKVGRLRPVLIDNWTRHSVSIQLYQHETGKLRKDSLSLKEMKSGYFLNCKEAEKEVLLSILRFVDGSRSVAEICKLVSCSREPKRSLFLHGLRRLWRANALTWLPPHSP